jgi:S1-C subfamily serine protease
MSHWNRSLALNLSTALLMSTGLAATAAPAGSESGNDAAAARQARTSERGALTREYQQLRDTFRDALVTIRFVMKIEDPMGGFAGENEIAGVIISADGAVLCSNLMLGGNGGQAVQGRCVPTDIKVHPRDCADGLDARFVARDSELDLAWLKIQAAPGRKFACIDLTGTTGAPTPQLGERVLGLGLMGRYFGQEVLVTESRVVGRTHKPRDLYVIRGALDTDPGLPVFTADGQVLGFACIQSPDPQEFAPGTNYAAVIARGRGLILPLQTVRMATRRALGTDEAGAKAVAQ